MHSDRLKNVCKLGTLLVFSGVIHAGTIVAIDGSADVTGLPGSIVGWGFTVSSDPTVFPLFTGSQFTPDPNTDGVYQDYLAPTFFFGTGGSTVPNPFDPFTLGGAGEFDISSTATLGDFVAGSLQLYWDEYSVSPMDPAFDPQADLLQSGQSQILDVSVSVGTPQPPVSSEAPEPPTYWLCLAGAALCAIGKRGVGRAARIVAVLAALMIFHRAAQAQEGMLPNLTSAEQDAINILRYHFGAEAVAGACHPGSDTSIVTGCCGSPGVTGCVSSILSPSGTNPASGFYCTAPSSNILRIDSYDTFSGGGHPIDCNLAPPSCDTAVTTSIQRLAIGANPTPQSVTFFFTSDIHFYRPSWQPENQIRHVSYLSNPGAQSWTYARDPIAAPAGLVIGGDIGLDASATDVGAVRLLYENNIAASLRMPMFFGLGNHETVTQTDASGAHRMFDYVTGRMNCGGINQDPATGNYSWDWGRLHLVMLNTWADDTASKYNQNTSGHGLTWLANDLANNVGVTGRPVILFQHYGFTEFSFDPTKSWWSTQNATDFLNAVKNYNIVGIFNGHTHKPSVQRLDATDWAADAGMTLKDSAGNEKVIDFFTNGTGGEGGSGDFIAVRYQDGMTPDSAPYLDVESMHWDNTVGMTKGITTTSTHPEGLGSDYYGGRSACRKRIGPRFNDIHSLVNVTLLNNPGNRLMGGRCVTARSMGTVIVRS